MNEEHEITLKVKPTAITPDWITYQVIEVYASLKRDGSDHAQRFVHTKLSPEENKQIVLAHQRHLGAGQQPENSVTYIELEDALVSLFETLDNAVQRAEKLRKEKQDW